MAKYIATITALRKENKRLKEIINAPKESDHARLHELMEKLHLQEI